MALTTTFTVGSGYALQIAASPSSPVTLYVKSGGTIYYSSERLVSSSSNEASVEKEKTSAQITQPVWVISASNSQVEVAPVYAVSPIEAPTSPTGFYVGNWSPNTAESGTDTTPAEKKLFTGSLFLPVDKKITGIGYLVGSVGGTNKAVAGLFDVNGNLLAHSSETTEGTTVGTAKEIQELALTTPYAAVGPATYFVGITMNGNTARIRTIPSNTIGSNVFSKEITLTSKNVLANITAPTAVEQGKAPVAWVY